MKTSLGMVKGVAVEVTQRGAEPAALVADHPGGKVGAVTPSKFSSKTCGLPHGVTEAVVVAVAVGVGLVTGPVMVMSPSTWVAAWLLKSPSMNTKLLGIGCQVSGVERPGIFPVLSILRLQRVPEPESGVRSFEIAEKRSVRVGPGPGIRAPDTFQLPEVSPAFWTTGFENVQMVSSKVKSPWKPM